MLYEVITNLKRSLETIIAIVRFIKQQKDENYPTLKKLLEQVQVFPYVKDRIDRILDQHGKIRDVITSYSIHYTKLYEERTGSMDEVQVGAVKDEKARFEELIKRKETILNTIEEQDKLTGELNARIENCWNSTELEDIYLPYKPKRKTKATIAREKGLEPLAKIIMKQQERDLDFRALSFVQGERNNFV